MLLGSGVGPMTLYLQRKRAFACMPSRLGMLEAQEGFFATCDLGPF